MADYSNIGLDALSLAQVGPEDRIARYFKLYELTKSETADRQRIDNRIASDEVLRSAVHLAREVLDPIREAFGSFTPNSVFRCQALERALKGRPSSWLSTSQHTMGWACDVEITAKPTLDLAEWCAKNLASFDQIICECHDPAKGPNSGWVHVSLVPPGRGSNRKQSLSYVMDPTTGRLAYVTGLQASAG